MTTVAEAASAYEKAKAALASAKADLAAAQAREKDCAEKERTAYKAFNEAVSAMKPKRGSRPKKGAAVEGSVDA